MAASGRKFVFVPNCLATIVSASCGKFFWFLFFIVFCGRIWRVVFLVPIFLESIVAKSGGKFDLVPIFLAKSGGKFDLIPFFLESIVAKPGGKFDLVPIFLVFFVVKSVRKFDLVPIFLESTVAASDETESPLALVRPNFSH